MSLLVRNAPEPARHRQEANPAPDCQAEGAKDGMTAVSLYFVGWQSPRGLLSYIGREQGIFCHQIGSTRKTPLNRGWFDPDA
jgi:hypothetical protein